MIDKNFVVRVYIIVYRNKKTGVTRSRCWLTKSSWMRNRHRLECSRIYLLVAIAKPLIAKSNISTVK